MAKPENRLQLMNRLGAVQANNVWAWCGVNEAKRIVYLSMWADKIYWHQDERCYILQEPLWKIGGSAEETRARKDHDEKLGLVKAGYKAYGYLIKAKNTNAEPREIAQTFTDSIVPLTVVTLDNETVIGIPGTWEPVT